MKNTLLLRYTIGNSGIFVIGVSQLPLQRDWNQNRQVIQTMLALWILDVGSATRKGHVVLGSCPRFRFLHEHAEAAGPEPLRWTGKGRINKHLLCEATEGVEAVYGSHLTPATQSEVTDDTQVREAGKPSRTRSVRGLDSCTKEAVGNSPVFFFRNNLGI